MGSIDCGWWGTYLHTKYELKGSDIIIRDAAELQKSVSQSWSVHMRTFLKSNQPE